MICSDVLYLVQAKRPEALARIVVVQIRHPPGLPAPAAVFSNVVGGCGSGHERQIHRHSRLVQLAGHMHGNVVDPSYVTQRVERGYVYSYPGELVDVPAPDELVHVDVLGRESAGGDLLV